MRESADWDLVGIHAETDKLRDTYAKVGCPLLSPEELLRAAEVIVVESAVRDHFRHTKLALNAGKHVHVEKPPAVTRAEFHELQSLAAARGCLMQMGYMWRYHPGIDKLIEAVQRGWLGEVTLVRGAINSNYPSAAARHELAEFRGGGMWELGCHLIDAVVRMLDMPLKISSTLRAHGSFNDQLADNTVAIFEYPRALAIISVNLMQPNASAHRFLEITGTNGTATLRPIEPPILQFDLAKAAGPYAAKLQTIPLPKYQRYVPELADLADAVRTHRPLAVTPDTDLSVHENSMGHFCNLKKKLVKL